MTSEPSQQSEVTEPPIINLATAPGEGSAWDKPRYVVYLWAVAELLFVTNPWQISSALRVAVLRAFGADIGVGVIFRPRTRVRFPWKLKIGDRSWIGEGAWIHNQAQVTIGCDVVLSQECFVSTGSHAHRVDMALLTSPVSIGSGTWISTRAILLGGTVIGKSCLISPGSVVGPMQSYDDGLVLTGNPAVISGYRFRRKM